VKIIIVGLGGIGSWLIEPLIRYCLHETQSNCEFVFIDGDHYSHSNQTRQSVHPKLMGMNKASAAALRMRQYFPGVNIKEVPEFLTESNMELINSFGHLIVFNCCDNNYCRKILAERFEKISDNMSVLFTGGNEVTDGNSHVHVVGHRATNITDSVLKSHPEIKDASNGEDRGAMSCQQLANMPSSRQVVITNFWCAAIMLQQFYLVVKKIPIQETFFDINTSAINAIKQTR
jgi:hypothetical protein